MKHLTVEGSWLHVKRRTADLWSRNPWSVAYWKIRQDVQQQGAALSAWEDEGGKAATVVATTALVVPSAPE